MVLLFKNNIDCKKINKPYLELTDLNITEYDTNYLKSIEGTAKSHVICQLIQNYSIDPNNSSGIKKYIIINPNVATLATIKSMCKERKLDVTYYKKASNDQIRNAKILIITMNSLYKILNDDMLIENANQTLVWLDELNIIYHYINSSTIKIEW